MSHGHIGMSIKRHHLCGCPRKPKTFRTLFSSELYYTKVISTNARYTEYRTCAIMQESTSTGRVRQIIEELTNSGAEERALLIKLREKTSVVRDIRHKNNIVFSSGSFISNNLTFLCPLSACEMLQKLSGQILICTRHSCIIISSVFSCSMYIR